MYYTHLEPGVKIISGLFDRDTIRQSLFKLDKNKFLDIPVSEGSFSYKIRDYIYNHYTSAQKSDVDFDAENITLESPINVGTRFWIEDSYMIRDFLFSQTKNIVPTTNTTTFIAEHIDKLFSNKGYKKSSTFASYTKLSSDFQVFAWVRSLNDEGNVYSNIWAGLDTVDMPEPTVTGKWVNLTSFVKGIETTVAETGGNFSIELAPVMCVYDEGSGGWKLENKTIHGNLSSLKTPYYAKTALQSIKDGKLKRSNIFFHNILGENDLIYIRFEGLEMENDYKRDNLNIEVTGGDVVKNIYTKSGGVEAIGGNIYDMIGMVDKNSIALQFNGNVSASVNIQGRDLVKAFIDDGVFFFPKEFSSGKFFMSGGTSTQGKLLQRNLFDANIQSLAVYQEKDIQYILQFVISQLSNTGYVPDSVFDAYKERRNTSIKIDDNVGKTGAEETELANAKTNITNRLYQSLYANDRYFTSRNVSAGLGEVNGYNENLTTTESRVNAGKSLLESWVDYMVSNYQAFKDYETIPPYKYNGNDYPDGNQLPIELLGTILPSLRPDFSDKQAAEQPTVKITASNAYTLYETFDLSDAIQSVKELLKKKKNSNFLKDGSVKEEILKGIWQIIDIVIDDNVRNRILVDTSVSGHQGNILTALQKVCIKPFAEMMFDTYGDRYCVVIRQQPFDYNGVSNCITGKGLSYRSVKDGKKTPVKLPSDIIGDLTGNSNKVTGIEPLWSEDGGVKGLIVDIEESVIQSENISWYCGDVYTWYRINPQGYLFGSQNALTWLFLPAIYLPEYAEVWGSRPWVLNSPYIVDKSYQLDSNEAFKKDPLLVQSYYDLKYMIDSTCYLPFTKVGTIVIAGGDRRIKRGTWVRRVSSGEVFYVESVQNIGSYGEKVDRRTVITVTHGMVEKYINKVNDGRYDTPISYFNIVNTELNFSKNKVERKDYVQTYDDNSNIYSDNVLKNFKVNKEVFNFFLSRNQFK